MKRHTPDRLFLNLCRLAAFLCVSILLAVLILLIIAGGSVITWSFLTQTWQHQAIESGGIAQAIVGSAIVGIGVVLLSFPLGLGTAIYLTEYSRENIPKRLIELAIRNLAGVPSVVIGLFGLAFFVHGLKFGSSLLAAIATLSIMTLPWIIAASVEALQSVPRKFRDSSFALGATRWQTIHRIVLPAGLQGCLTGAIISMARAMGETAPIIMVGATFYLTGFPHSLSDRFLALPYHTFILATQHAHPQAQSYAAGSALVLMMLTFLLSSVAIGIRYRIRTRKVW